MGELDEAMCEAIALGERAGKQGDVPVGAVVLDERGTVIGRGRNRREAGHDRSIAQAEEIKRESYGIELGIIQDMLEAGDITRAQAKALRRNVFVMSVDADSSI